MMGTGRESALVRAGRLLQRVPLAWLRWAELPFVYVLKKARRDPNMIFILALPRSGSTLTYQMIVHALQAGYLTNLGNLLFQIPLLGGMLSALSCRRHHSDFSSDYGFVPGLCGPAEGLQFWRYWQDFRLDERNPFEMNERLRNRREGYLRRVFSLLSRPDYPYVAGFLGHSLMPERLKPVFSSAVVVRLYRDPVSNALSILKSRRASGSDWFSLFPAECQPVLGRGVHEEVAAQVYWLNRRLDEAHLGDNVFALNYEALCEDPRAQMAALAKFCNERGMTVAIKGEVPDSFKCNQADIEHDRDASRLKMAIAALESRYGKLHRCNDQ